MPKIIIIENQKEQFKILRQGLVANNVASANDIYPKVSEWQSFMNHIKIAINNDYDYIEYGEYLRVEKKEVYDIIQEKRPDLIIIDYLLGGATCEKGVELAIDIVNNVANQQLSIIFVSRERPSNDYDEFKEKNKGKIYVDWLSKSYSQDKILENPYIKNVLCRDIKSIIDKNLCEKINKYIILNEKNLIEDQLSSLKKVVKKIEKGETINSQGYNIIWEIINRNKSNISSDETELLLSIN